MSYLEIFKKAIHDYVNGVVLVEPITQKQYKRGWLSALRHQNRENKLPKDILTLKAKLTAGLDDETARAELIALINNRAAKTNNHSFIRYLIAELHHVFPRENWLALDPKAPIFYSGGLLYRGQVMYPKLIEVIFSKGFIAHTNTKFITDYTSSIDSSGVETTEDIEAALNHSKSNSNKMQSGYVFIIHSRGGTSIDVSSTRKKKPLLLKTSYACPQAVCFTDGIPKQDIVGAVPIRDSKCTFIHNDNYLADDETTALLAKVDWDKLGVNGQALSDITRTIFTKRFKP